MACTSLLLSSRAADAVEVPKDAAPLWRPRIMRPSFLYCSMGSQNRSLTPWTGEGGEKGMNRETRQDREHVNVNLARCVCSRNKQHQLTKLDNRVHGPNTSQDTRQLILPDVRQPLCDGVLDHFVHTEEARKCCRRNVQLQIPTGFKRDDLVLVGRCAYLPMSAAEPLQFQLRTVELGQTDQNPCKRSL